MNESKICFLKAFIFSNGNVIYFDEKGDQIPYLNKLGLSGLKTFVEKYPNSSVYWCVWSRLTEKIPIEDLKQLLNYIKDPEIDIDKK